MFTRTRHIFNLIWGISGERAAVYERRAKLASLAILPLGLMIGLFTYQMAYNRIAENNETQLAEVLPLLQRHFSYYDLAAVEGMGHVLSQRSFITSIRLETNSGLTIYENDKFIKGLETVHPIHANGNKVETEPIGYAAIGINHDRHMVRNRILASLLSIFVLFLVTRAVFGFYALRDEVEARKIRELQTLEREQKLRTTLASIGDAVITTDNAGIISSINPIGEELTGVPAAEAVGKRFEEIVHLKAVDVDTKQPQDPTGALKADEATSSKHRKRLISAQGIEQIVSTSAAPITLFGSDVLGMVFVIRNITDDVLKETKVREFEKMRAIGTLAGGVAHDFNNLLGVVSSSAELLLMEESSNISPESIESLNSIVESAERGATLVANLLAFGRGSTSMNEVFSLHKAIEVVTQILRRTSDKRFQVELDLKAGNDRLIGSRSMMENALLNMGLNAAHAMQDKGGVLRISTRNLRTDFVEGSNKFHGEPNNECVEIVLSDSGVGISTENLSRIFEPFFTTRSNSGGTGLGLSAVYGTIRKFGGAIHVTSAVGIGTKFTIRLPNCELMPTFQPKPKAENKTGARTVLIVDDEPILLRNFENMLSAMGHTTILAANGEEGIELFKQNRDRIDLTILDMNMPDLSGDDVLRAIRAIDLVCPVYICSGYSEAEQIEKLRNLNVAGYLEKPFRFAELQNIIYEASTDRSKVH